MKKTVIIYGLISGAIVSLFMSVSMITMSKNGVHSEDMGTSMIIGYLSMLIAFAFIFVAVKNYRDRYNNGTVSFGRAFSIGLLVALIASTMYVITWAFVFNTYLPNFMESYSAEMIKQASAKLSGAALQDKIAEINKGKEIYATPVGFILFTYAEILPVGILVSLIAALILKRKKQGTGVPAS
jgi:small-conductance mechanosensitive channel